MLRVHPLGGGKPRFSNVVCLGAAFGFAVLWALGLRAFGFWFEGLSFLLVWSLLCILLCT
jgi:hypothetical protein